MYFGSFLWDSSLKWPYGDPNYTLTSLKMKGFHDKIDQKQVWNLTRWLYPQYIHKLSINHDKTILKDSIWLGYLKVIVISYFDSFIGALDIHIHYGYAEPIDFITNYHCVRFVSISTRLI